MTPQTRLIAIAGGVAFVVAAAVAFWFTVGGNRTDEATWSPDTRAAFMRSCVEACRKAPGMTEDKYPLCDKVCSCSADETERTMSPRELSLAEEAIRSGTATTEQTDKIKRITAAGMSCAANRPALQK